MENLRESTTQQLIEHPLVALPPQAKQVYSQAWHQAMQLYGSKEFANQQGWTAVGQAGYHRDMETGEWDLSE